MQLHDYDAAIHAKEQRLNRSKWEEVVPRYRFVSPSYYRKDHENVKFEQRAQNFEPLICYMVEQKVVTQGIIMFTGVESVLVTK